MFVVNANWQNSWYSCISINWIYNPPMDGSCFVFYNHTNIEALECFCFRYCFQDCADKICDLCHISSWWNGACPDSSTYLPSAACSKVNDFSANAFFPQVITWNPWDNYSFCIASKYFFCTMQYYSSNMTGSTAYTIPERINYFWVSNKTFDWWLCVWRTIDWFLWVGIDDRTRYNSCTNCYTAISYRTWNIEWYISMWLMHDDWTTEDFYCCVICTSTWKAKNTYFSTVDNYWSCKWVITNWNRNERNCCYITNPNVNLIYWQITTPWLTTSDWDRIFVKVWNHSTSWCIYTYNSNYCQYSSRLDTNIVVYGWTYARYWWHWDWPDAYKNWINYPAWSWCTNWYTWDSCGKYWLCSWMNSANDESRFIWLQFSVED